MLGAEGESGPVADEFDEMVFDLADSWVVFFSEAGEDALDGAGSAAGLTQFAAIK